MNTAMTADLYNRITADIIAYLQAHGVGNFGEDLFAEYLPQEPAKALMVETTGGFESDMAGGYVFATFRLLARSDGPDPRPAKALLGDAYRVLHGVGGRRLVGEGLWVIRAQAIQGAPVNIDRDENNRQRFSQNYQIEVKGSE